MKYKAVRPFYGDGGMVRKGQVLDLDKERVKALGALVVAVSDQAAQPPALAPEPVQADAKADPAPQNKMADEPVNKAAPKTKRAPKEG